jgi:hypothetical protein
MTAYLTKQLKDAADFFTVSMTVMRKGAPHELLKPWEDAEDSNINKTILAYYISMLSIINTEYNDDSSRHIMLNAYVERFSIQEVMDVLRCLLHSLSTGVIPSEWRVHFPTPELAQKKLRMDVDALLAIPENYTAYMDKMASPNPEPEPKQEEKQVMAPPKQVMAPPKQVMAPPKQVMLPEKPEAKQAEQVMPLPKQVKPEPKPVRLRSFGYSIGLNDETSQRVLRKAVESAGLYNVLCKLEFLLRVWDKYPCMRFLERDHAFVKGLLEKL